MIFRLWNYGLFGDEKASEVPGAYFETGVGYLIDLPSEGDFLAFCETHSIKGITFPLWRDGKILPSIQLPTTYSTCGALGYDDAQNIPAAKSRILSLFRAGRGIHEEMS